MILKGTIKSVCTKPDGTRPTFGFIKGDDGIDRFFIPGGMVQPTPDFATLVAGLPVEFEHEDGPHDPKTGRSKGPRAVEVRIVSSGSSSIAA